MNNKKTEHSKRLSRTRQEFSQLTKSEVNKWKRIKQMKESKRLEELQNQEIERINKQLSDLREEYKRIASERGSAHKWAQIVAKHESDANDFEKRRNAEVLKRSKHTLNHFIDDNTLKQNNIQIEKQNQILRRKQLMKSSLAPQTHDREVVDILRQLNDLKQSEAVLKKVIEKKTELSHSEESIERIAEKLFWPKTLVSKQEFLDSNASDNDSKDSIHILSEKQTKFKPFVDKQNKRFFDSLPTQVFKVSESDDKTDEYLPISIATKLYERLRTHRNQTNTLPNNKKVYRNVAISTTPQKSLEINNESFEHDHLERSSLNSSHPTSYFSVPTVPNMATNKATLALSQIYKNLNNRLNSFENKSQVNYLGAHSLQDLTLEDDSASCVDPLMTRINNLKELIDKKVGKSSITSTQLSNCGHSDENISEPELPEENKISDKSELKDDMDAISSSSSVSFKTLHALSCSGRSSPSFDSSLQVLDILNNDFVSVISNAASNGCLSHEIQSNSSSFVDSEPLRDRNAFWKDIFERAGIHIDTNKIDEFFPTLRPESEPTVDNLSSFTLSTFSTDPNSHSTPKH